MSAVPADQAAHLRELMRSRATPAPPRRARPARLARVFAIASGKGGVGKTNIAVNLALAFVARGRRVVLVDADLGTANVDVVLNVQPRFDLSHVMRQQHSLDDVVVDVSPGLRLIPGASGLAGVSDLDAPHRAALLDELTRLESRCDVLMFDCGAGISQNVLAFARAADELLVVTTPEPTAMTDAYALVKVLVRGDRVPGLRLVVNQAADTEEARAVAGRLGSTAERFLGRGIEFAGQILRDPAVPAAVRQRVPFILKSPRSPAAACVAALADRLDRTHLAPRDAQGFFRRLAGFFY